MNFLAHIFLSGEDELLKIGNFAADSMRGKEHLTYPPKIQQGIILHREIDTYTDNHPIWRQSKKIIVPQYNHYAAVIVDMYYDHFLAKNWNQYSQIPLEQYADEFYQSLIDNYEILPLKIKGFLHIMIAENWLVLYRTIDGLRYILSQMDKRSKGVSKMQYSTKELQDNYSVIESQFTLFFEDLRQHIKSYTL